MTATARRTLAYRYHNIEPGPPARDQWRVEQALARALDRHDTVEAAVVEVNAENGWALPVGTVNLLIGRANWADVTARNIYHRHHAAVDDYCETLRDLARFGVRPAYVGRHRDGRTARTSGHTGTHRAHDAAAVA